MKGLSGWVGVGGWGENVEGLSAWGCEGVVSHWVWPDRPSECV